MRRCGYCRKLLAEGQKSYCSDSCRDKAIANANRAKERSAPNVACIVCGAETHGDLYCSRECAQAQLKRALDSVVLEHVTRGEDTRVARFYEYFEKHVHGWRRTG